MSINVKVQLNCQSGNNFHNFIRLEFLINNLFVLLASYDDIVPVTVRINAEKNHHLLVRNANDEKLNSNANVRNSSMNLVNQSAVD